MPTVTANADGSYTITVPAPVAPAPLVPDVQGVSLEDLQKEQADLAVVDADVTAEVAEVTPAAVVEPTVTPTA